MTGYSKKIDIGQGGNEYIELHWTRGFEQVRITLDGKELGRFDGRQELHRGKTFSLYGDETLYIAFSVKHASFVIKRNGTYVDASPYHPRHHMAPFTWVAFLMGLIYLICGSITLVHALDEMYLPRYYVYLSYFCLLGLAFMTVPFLLRQGFAYWMYVLLALIAGMLGWNIYLLVTFGVSSNPAEDLLVMFFINLPALVILVMLLVLRRRIKELGRERALRANFGRLIS